MLLPPNAAISSRLKNIASKAIASQSLEKCRKVSPSSDHGITDRASQAQPEIVSPQKYFELATQNAWLVPAPSDEWILSSLDEAIRHRRLFLNGCIGTSFILAEYV